MEMREIFFFSFSSERRKAQQAQQDNSRENLMVCISMLGAQVNLWPHGPSLW